MGLDSYLHAKKYVGGWQHRNDPEFDKLKELFGVTPTDRSPSFEVSATVAYWRKANQIHAWFIQDEESDNCQDVYVSREKLEELHLLCCDLLDSHEVSEAKDRLPTKGGFFFGDTEYGEYYWEDLENTAEQLNRILHDPVLEQGWDFYYRASW